MFFNDVLKTSFLTATLGIVNNTLGCRGSPVGKHCTKRNDSFDFRLWKVL